MTDTAGEPDLEFVRRYEPQPADSGRTMIHAYYLIGPKGTVQFKYMDRPEGLPRDPRADGLWPLATDLGYHSPIELFEGQYRTAPGECPYMAATLRKFPCFYDGSALNAEHPLKVFLAGGTDALWPLLREYYGQVFESEEYVVGFGQLLTMMFSSGGPPAPTEGGT